MNLKTVFNNASLTKAEMDSSFTFKGWQTFFGLALLLCPTLVLAEPPQAVSGEVEAEEQRLVDEALSASAEESNEVIVVTGARRETPLSEAVVATEVINREEVEGSGADNVAELLEEHPGVEVISGLRGRSVRMQGMDSKYVLVLVNGQRTTGRIDGALDLERFTIDEIERVEIVKGPSSALYGSDALAGVINIITRKPRKRWVADGRGTLKARGQLDASATVGSNTGKVSTQLTVGVHRGDGYDLTPDTPNTTASGYRQLTGSARASIEIGKVELRASLEARRQDLDGIDENDTGAVFDRRSITEEVGAEVRADIKEYGGMVVLRHQAFRDQLLLDQHMSRDLDSLEKTRQNLTVATVQKNTTWAKHVLSVGAELSLETLSADRLSTRGRRFRGSPYISHEWSLADGALVLSPGARVDVDSQFGVYVSPKFSLRYSPIKKITARMGYGRGFRAPNFRELLLRFENPGVGYLVEGNPNLTPETSHGATVNVEYQPADWAWLSVGGFANKISDLINLDSMSGGGVDAMQGFTYVNIASARTAGVEVRARVKFGRSLSLDTGYLFTSSRDNATGQPLPGRAKHRVSLTAKSEFQDIRAMTRASVSSTRQFTAVDGATSKVEPIITLDARCSYRLGRRLEAFIGAENILDNGGTELFPIAPRTLYGGTGLRY